MTVQVVSALVRELQAGAAPATAVRSVGIEFPGHPVLEAVLADLDTDGAIPVGGPGRSELAIGMEPRGVGAMAGAVATGPGADREVRQRVTRGHRVREAASTAVAGSAAERLADSAALSRRLGLPWSGVLTALVVDLRAAERIRTQRAAAMAGPRLSGWVLAALPLVGLVLGYGMGTDPIGLLTTTTAGQLVLVTGSVLSSAGLWWVRRIAR